MAEGEESTEEEVKRGLGLKVWLLVAILALGVGGGGFFATYTGLLGGTQKAETHDEDGQYENHTAEIIEEPDFIELEPLQVAVGGEGSIRKLQFRAYLEIGSAGAKPVKAVQPRILDVFATYLRALPVATLEDPTALLRIRSQLLRRVQLLTGPDAVEDLLIIDFVIV